MFMAAALLSAFADEPTTTNYGTLEAASGGIVHTGSDGKPLQVFILAGQSNMQGQAKVSTFEHIGMDPATKPMLESCELRFIEHIRPGARRSKIGIQTLASPGGLKLGELLAQGYQRR